MNIFKSIVSFYSDGFRNMSSVGRQLWLLIIVKVIILFGILKLFFFPDVIDEKTEPGNEGAQTVRTEIINRSVK